MRSFVDVVIKFRLLIVALTAGLLALGAIQLRAAPVDVLPEFSPPYAEIQTEALGLSAEEVEQLITVPLEADLLNGVEGVDVIRSESVPGLSSIVLVFSRGTDVYRARQLVEERLTQAHALPNVSRPPTLLQPLSSSNRVLLIGLSSDELTPIEQSVMARWTVRPRLMGVPGVANVSVWGMRDQQLQVQVDPAQLRDRRVTLSQVVNTAGNAQVVSPLTFLEASTPGTGGFVETPQQRLQVRHLLEKIADPAELAKVPVEDTKGRLKLSDVAQVKVDHQPLIGDAVVAGGPGLLMVVEKVPGASTPEVTRDVEAALDQLRPGLAGMVTDTEIFRPSSYISEAIDHVGIALLAGALLMLLVLAVLRFQWRGLVIAAVTIPASLLAATLTLQLLDQGINALVLAGLAAAAAVVVDEAIAPIDRLMQKLRDRGDGSASVSSVVRDAAVETRRPLAYATLIVLLALVPLSALDGRPGDFFTPLALAYVLAVLAAMVVALVVAPALAVLIFARWRPDRQVTSAEAGSSVRQPAQLPAVQSRYAALFSRFSRGLMPAVIASLVCALVALVLLPFLGTSPLPAFKDPNLLIRLEGVPGTSNQAMTAATTQVVESVQALPGVAGAAGQVGRAITGDRVVNVSSSEVSVSLTTDADHDETKAAIEQVVGAVAGVKGEVVSASTQELRDIGALHLGTNAVKGQKLDVLTGIDKPVAVRVFGQDPAVLATEAKRVQEMMATVEGVQQPQVVTAPVQPTVEIEVDLEKALAFGITPGDVRRAEATLLQGIQVGSVFQQQKVFDVIVQGAPGTRRSVEDVRNLLIDRPGGGHLRLGQVADVRIAQTPAVISRDAVSRRVDVVADVSGRSAAAVATDLERRLAGTTFPMEYHAEVLRQSTGSEMATGRVLGVSLAAALAAFLLLQAFSRSWRVALLLFGSVALALVGGLVAGALTGLALSLGALLGLLAVFGLALRTSLLLVAHIQHTTAESNRDAIGLPDSGPRQVDADEARTAVRQAAEERLMPAVRSLAAVAAVALPFAILGPRTGLEILQPMAVAVLGGLVTTALMTLFVLPAWYLHFAPRLAARHADEEEALAYAGRSDHGQPPHDGSAGGNGRSSGNGQNGNGQNGNGQEENGQRERRPVWQGASDEEPSS